VKEIAFHRVRYTTDAVSVFARSLGERFVLADGAQGALNGGTSL
jgi:hypothetical protein